MLYWIVICLSAFLLCVFCAGFVIPEILLIAFRKRLFDVPDERKIHHSAVPRLGGIAFKPVVFLVIAMLLGVSLMFGHEEILSGLYADARAFAFAFCSIMTLYLVGMADDLIGIRYRAKFVVQILCGAMLAAGGVWVDNLYGVFGIHAIPAWLGCPITVLLTVFIINAINLIDGIDGLASGLCGVACLFYGAAFLIIHQYIYALLSFATLGVLVPFFYYNVFGNPNRGRKIFMGDTGSLTIGMMICFLSVKLALCGADGGTGSVHPFVLAFSPLLVPCCDVVRVFLHRIRTGRDPFMPDKNHIHHKLLSLGMGQRRAMVTIITTSVFFALLNIILSMYVNVNWLLVGDIGVWTAINIWLTKRILQLRPGLSFEHAKIKGI